MHEVLKNLSLLTEIFDFLPTEPGKPHHLAAALTCRTFLSPALDALWRELHIVEHPLILVKSIPGVRARPYKITNGGSKTYSVYFHDKPLSRADLDKFTAYTRRVRKLDFTFPNPGTRNTIHPSLISCIISTLNGESLFPNLRCLKISGHVAPWGDSITPMSLYMPHLFSPRLKHFNIALNGNPKHARDVWDFIYTLAQKPSLQLTKLMSSLRVVSSVFDALPTLRSLEDLEAPTTILSFTSILRLASLENLKNLTIGFEYGLRFPEPVQSATFSTLKVLTFTSLCTPESLARLFALVNFPALVSIKFNLSEEFMRERGGGLPWEKYMSIIAASFPNLHTFRTTSPKDAHLPWSTFSPLLDLAHLAHLSLHGPSVESLDNSDVVRMVSAWPKLETLSIWAYGMTEIDHTSLSAMSKGLQKLVKLELPINLSNVPMSRQSGDSSFVASTSKLKRLTIRYPLFQVLGPFGVSRRHQKLPLPSASDAQKMHRLARYLDDLFPALKDVRLHVKEEESKQAFAVLVEFLGCMRTTRSDERRKRQSFGV